MKPRDAFGQQRRNARLRGIEWLLTFDEWWAIWDASGRWADRGRCDPSKYVMSRIGDIGPYSAENVRICSCAENSREARRVDGAIGLTCATAVLQSRSQALAARVGELKAQGLTYQQVAERLGIAISTAWKHYRGIAMGKQHR